MELDSRTVAACVLVAACMQPAAQVLQRPSEMVAGSGLNMETYCREFEARQAAAAAAPGAARNGAGRDQKAHEAVRAAAQQASAAAADVEAEGPDPEIMAAGCRMARQLRQDDKSRLHRYVFPRHSR